MPQLPSILTTILIARPTIRSLAGGMGLAAALALPATAEVFSSPRPGVICDSRTLVCYDSQGISVPITGQTYGPRAANQLLLRYSGQPPQREFTLSGGQVCNVSRRICWDDGWRSQPNPMLTRQLFGSAPTPGQRPGNPPANAAGNRQCELNQRGLPVFKGSCNLQRQSDGYGQSYALQLGGGQTYRFLRRGASLVLRDATGTWPVFASDRGNSVQFRWANMMLLVSRPLQARGGSQPMASPLPRSTGESASDLIDSLLP